MPLQQSSQYITMRSILPSSKGCFCRMQAWSPKSVGELAIVMHAGHMAELENAAWKDDRRFRVLTFDKGAFSFADFFFHTPSKPKSGSGPPSEHMHLEEGQNISITGAVCSFDLIISNEVPYTWCNLP